MPKGALVEVYHQLKERLSTVAPASIAEDVAIMRVVFPEDNLVELRRWKALVQTLSHPFQPMGRHFLSAEIDPKYVEVIEKRLALGRIAEEHRLMPRKEDTEPSLPFAEE